MWGEVNMMAFPMEWREKIDSTEEKLISSDSSSIASKLMSSLKKYCFFNFFNFFNYNQL
jgi:hypothetical protein